MRKSRYLPGHILYFTRLLGISSLLFYVSCQDSTKGTSSPAKTDFKKYFPVEEEQPTETPPAKPSGPPVVTIKEPTIKNFEIAVSNRLMTIGTQQDVSAFAIFADNSRRVISSGVEWKTDHPDIASFSEDLKMPSRLIAKKTGRLRVTAVYKTATAHLEIDVVDPQLERIELPQNLRNFLVGIPQRFKATAIYSNGLTMDLNAGVDWQSSDPELFFPEPGSPIGTFKALVAKNYSLNVTAGGVSASLSVTASIPDFKSIELEQGPVQMPIGTTINTRVFGVLQNNDKIDITQAVSWSSTRPASVSVTTQPGRAGTIRAEGSGSAIITATVVSQGRTLTASREITVIAIEYRSIKIMTTSNTIPLFYKKQLIAIGVRRDLTEVEITNEVEWSSLDPTIASVSNMTSGEVVGVKPGEVTGVKQGDTKIMIKVGEKSATADVKVTDVALVEIAVVKPTKTINCGDPAAQTFLKITGVMSDGKESPDLNLDAALSWDSTDKDIAEVESSADSKGRVISKKPGVVKAIARYFVSATNETLESSLDLTIAGPVPVGYVLGKRVDAVNIGGSVELLVTRKYSCVTGGSPNPVLNKDLVWSLKDGNSTTSPYVSLIASGDSKMILKTTPTNSTGSNLLTQDRIIDVIAKTKLDNITADCSDGVTGSCKIKIQPRVVTQARLRYLPVANNGNVDVNATTSPSIEIRYSDSSIFSSFDNIAQQRYGASFSLDFSSTPDVIALDDLTGLARGIAVGSATVKVLIQEKATSGIVASATQEITVNIQCPSPGNRFSRHCFYTGDINRNCREVCSAVSRDYDHYATSEILGTSDDCKTYISQAFASSALVQKWYGLGETAPSVQNIGCRIDDYGSNRWKPYFDPGTSGLDIQELSSMSFVRRVCGCR